MHRRYRPTFLIQKEKKISLMTGGNTLKTEVPDGLEKQ